MRDHLTEKQITDLLKANFLREEAIQPDTSLFMSGLLDSISMLTFLSLIEESHETEILGDDFAVENFDTVRKITEFISRHKENV